MIHRHLGGADVWFTDRHGGTSRGPFASLNLAGHVGDDPVAVEANRVRVTTAIGRADARWLQPHHVHGTAVLVAQDDPEELVGAAPAWLAAGEEGDGVATDRVGLLLVAVGADCAPIAIANDTACAAIHAGWRGAVDGVVQAGVAAVRSLGVGPVRAVVGPCVCGAHYEFGAGLLAELVERVGPHVETTTTDGLPGFDLRAAIRFAFERSGVEEVEVLDLCTVESLDHYSYRRDGDTGRQGVVVTKQ